MCVCLSKEEAIENLLYSFSISFPFAIHQSVSHLLFLFEIHHCWVKHFKRLPPSVYTLVSPDIELVICHPHSPISVAGVFQLHRINLALVTCRVCYLLLDFGNSSRARNSPLCDSFVTWCGVVNEKDLRACT